MIKTSLVSLSQAVKSGIRLEKGMKVSLPVVGEAEIYGFIPILDDSSDDYIDMPPLGEATVLSNRIIFSLENKIYRFPIFNRVCTTDLERYEFEALYIPKKLPRKDGLDKQYKFIFKDKLPSPSKNLRVILDNNVAYYYPQEKELYFQSISKLVGIGDDFAVIVRRLSKISDDIKYELFTSNELMLEKI